MAAIYETGRSLDAISPSVPRVVSDLYQAFPLQKRLAESGQSLASVTPFTPRQVGLLGINGAATLPPSILSTAPYLAMPGSACGSTYDYGETSIGFPLTHVFTIVNTGAAVLDISSFSLVGSGYTIITHPPATVNPGQTITFSIRLDATTVAVPSGTVTIVNNTTQSPCILSLTGSVVGPHVTFTSYLGSFKWYGFLPYDYVDTGTGVVPERFLTKRIQGQDTMNEYASDLSSGIIGVAFTSVSDSDANSIKINAITGVQSGKLNSATNITGMICAGSSYSNWGNGTISIPAAADNIVSLYTNAYVFFTNFGISHLSQGFVGVPPQGTGYNISYCGNGISGGGAITEYLIDQNTIQNSAIAGGAAITTPQNSSRTNSYATTSPTASTYTGLATTMNITYALPSVSGNFTVTSNFTFTPVGGGTSFAKSIVQTIPVGVGGFLNINQDIPSQVGYIVTYTSGTIGDFIDVADDFEQQRVNWYGEIAANYVPQTQWATYSPYFGMALPGTENGSDWDVLVTGPYLSDNSGFYWAGTGFFSLFDNTQVYDDFELYPVGIPTVLQLGSGWTGSGFFSVFDFQMTTDDFETYPVGLLSLLNYQTLDIPINYWAADGSFAVFENLLALDDFESYATGTITILNGGSGWAATGSFAVFP